MCLAGEGEYRDDSHAFLYILFVVTFYAFFIVVLMVSITTLICKASRRNTEMHSASGEALKQNQVKYIKREREGPQGDTYYAEFVKRDWWAASPILASWAAIVT